MVAVLLVTGMVGYADEPEPVADKPEQNSRYLAVSAIKELEGRIEFEEGSVIMVDLGNTQVTDAGLVHLRGLTRVKSLNLHNTQVTDEGVKKLQQALPNCRVYRQLPRQP